MSTLFNLLIQLVIAVKPDNVFCMLIPKSVLFFVVIELYWKFYYLKTFVRFLQHLDMSSSMFCQVVWSHNKGEVAGVICCNSEKVVNIEVYLVIKVTTNLKQDYCVLLLSLILINQHIVASCTSCLSLTLVSSFTLIANFKLCNAVLLQQKCNICVSNTSYMNMLWCSDYIWVVLFKGSSGSHRTG